MHRLLFAVAVAASVLAAPAAAQQPVLTPSHRVAPVVVTPTPGATARRCSSPSLRPALPPACSRRRRRASRSAPCAETDETRMTDPRTGHVQTAPPPQPYAPEGEVHLLDRIAILYRYRRISLAVF